MRPAIFTIDRHHYLANSLMGAWLGMHGGSGHLLDSSVYGNHGIGTNIGTGDWVVMPDGRWGVYDDITPNKYFSTREFTHSGPITISFWMYRPHAGYQSIVAGGYGTNSTDDRVMPQFWNDGNCYWDYGSTASGRVSVSYAGYINKWTHVAMVSSGSANSYQAIYFDGQVVASQASSDGPSGLWPFDIHSCDAGSRYYFYGTIADMLLHFRMLSPNEITELSHLGNTMLSGLITPVRRRYWPVSSGAAAGPTIPVLAYHYKQMIA